MPSYTRSMASSNTIFEGEPAQPDYATKPVTALRNVMLKAISFVNKGANGKRFFLFKNEEGTGTIEDDNLVEYSALIKKHNPFGKDWEVAYCVIAEPNEVDKQRDIWEQDEIEKACNSFIEEGGLLNFMHEDMKKVGTLAQNALALEDIRITTTDGTVETIKKGSWYIGVKPNPEVKKMIDMGEITGMSVQGSAQREVVAKAAKDNGAIPMGTEGPGVIKLQNILGVEETGVYDQVTHDQVIAWMDEKGAPGVPSFATIKAILAGEPKPAAPVAPMASAAEAPVMPGVEKDQEGYIPTDQNAPTDHPQERNGTILGSGPGNVGVDRSNVTVESPDEDLKALIAEAINEENEALLQYLDSRYRVSSANSLYSVQIPREELWFMVSKFILGTEKKVLNESGDMVAEGEVSEPGVEKDEDPAPAGAEASPSGEIKAGDVVVHNGKGSVVEAVEGDMVVLLAMTKGGTEKKTKVPMSEVTLVGAKAVEKSSAGGSMGGHDPRKNGKIRFIVRSFGSWAGGLHRVCVARLKTEHPEVFKGNENAGCAWLKDQWAGTTKWRHGGGKLGKAAVAVEKALSSVNKSEALHEMLEKAEPEVIDAMFKQMCTDMGVDADEVMQKMDSEEFDAYLEKMFDTEDTAEAAEAPEGTEVEKAPDSPSDKVAGILRGDQPSEEKIAQIKEAISNKANGDVLDALKDAIEEVSKLPDDERKTGIEEIVEDFTSYIERKSQVSKSFSSGKLEENKTTDTFLNRGEEMDNINKEEQDRLVEAASYITSYFGGQADAATEVEKDAVAVEEEAVEETADEAPAAVDAPDETEAPEAEGPEAELDDENEAVSEEELVAVMNHMMQEVDRLSDRVGQLENLEKKLDQVGELAKALDVTDQLDSQGDTVSGLVKQLGEMSDAFETLKKRLEVVATTPGAPSALSVDEVEVVETVAKSAGNAGDPKSIWASSPISPV